MSFERDGKVLILLGCPMSEPGVICSDFYLDVYPALVTCFSYLDIFMVFSSFFGSPTTFHALWEKNPETIQKA